MLFFRRGGPGARRLLPWLLLLAAWRAGSAQLRYSVPEEAQHGTFVGRLAQDLGLPLAELVPRLFRVASRAGGDLLEVNVQNGILFVNARMDREALCGRSAECSVHLEVVVERPLQVFHVEVEVRDVNDNPPVFRAREQRIFIPESRLLESRFPLEGAADADVGANALLTYALSPSDYFSLEVQASEELSKSLSLVLKKSLDREETPEHHLLLTATDGGKPERKGSVQLLVTVLDVNDNAPRFQQAVYRVHLPETTANGTLVTTLNASDADEGVNGELVFSFGGDVSPHVQETFAIDPGSGEIRLTGALDYEEATSYEIQVNAFDKGSPPMSNHCKVLVKVLDVNDNAPELVVTSPSMPIREDAPVGTVVALVSVSDRDSGANGQVSCALTPDVPFRLLSTFRNYYSLVLESGLDRELVSGYGVVVTARDAGSPALRASASVWVEVADVNDNAPAFAQAEYTVFVRENNAPGCHLVTVSARDADARENARVSYSLVERRVGERLLSSYVSVHAESGRVHALQPLDREELELLRFEVSARDAGVPALGSNVTLQVFVLDENDHAPWVLPRGAGGPASEAVPVWVSRSAGAGHVVAKVRAVDADAGYNAWLSYELQAAPNANANGAASAAAGGARLPFRVGLYTGEISTTRSLDEADLARQRLLVLVKDHGEPALTATATVLLSLVDGGQAPAAAAGVASSSRAGAAAAAAAGGAAALLDVNASLIVAICAVSSLLVLTLVVWTALRCWAPAAEGACGPGQPALVCASAVGSWSCSQRRRQRVSGGEGAPKADLMAFSPGLSPGVNTSERGEHPQANSDLSGNVSPTSQFWVSISFLDITCVSRFLM
ncbi:protocadherin alpha-1-like [Lepus europaeus]|uniref:protocadherin alpha-1-like n=1 Tax=Lepus europaeus TaxID=9983 RepID=UPI002B467C1C|nr:protocadherin alpha-1-like [Lepus europaeus]